MIPIFFVYFALVSIAAGVLTVVLRNPVHCGLALLTLLLHVAGLFVLLNAEFLFAVQIIVYAGAILVLYLFVLMLLNLKTDERHLHRYLYASGTKIFFALAVIGITGELLLLMLRSPFGGAKGDAPPSAILTPEVTPSHAIGLKMFSEYLLPFEIVGVFLLGAIIGAIVLAKTPPGADAEGEQS